MDMTDTEAKAASTWRRSTLQRSSRDAMKVIHEALTEAHREGMEEEYRREINVRDRAATPVLNQKGYRFCDIPACNCGSWHSPPLEETNEYKRGMEEAAKVVDAGPPDRHAGTLSDVLEDIAAAIRKKT